MASRGELHRVQRHRQAKAAEPRSSLPAGSAFIARGRLRDSGHCVSSWLATGSWPLMKACEPLYRRAHFANFLPGGSLATPASTVLRLRASYRPAKSLHLLAFPRASPGVTPGRPHVARQLPERQLAAGESSTGPVAPKSSYGNEFHHRSGRPTLSVCKACVITH